MERRRRAVATTLLLTLLAARDAAAVSKVDVLKARKAAIQAEAAKISMLERQLKRAHVNHLDARPQRDSQLYGWDELDELDRRSMVRLDRPNQRTYHESEVRERLRSDPRASMREEARAAAAEELGSSSSQITDFLIFVMLFVGGYHGFLLFTKKREQIERVWTLVYAEVESWTSTHTPAVVAVLSRLKSAGTGAYAAAVKAWAELPSSLRSARDAVVKSSSSPAPLTAEERIRATRASIAAAKASMDAQQKIALAQLAAEAGLSPADLDGLSRKERVDRLKSQLATPHDMAIGA